MTQLGEDTAQPNGRSVGISQMPDEVFDQNAPTGVLVKANSLEDDFKQGWTKAQKAVRGLPKWVIPYVLVVAAVVKIANVSYGDPVTMMTIIGSASLGDLIVSMAMLASPVAMMILVPIVGFPHFFIGKFWKRNFSLAIVHAMSLAAVLLAASVFLPAKIFLGAAQILLLYVTMGWIIHLIMGPGTRLSRWFAKDNQRYDHQRKKPTAVSNPDRDFKYSVFQTFMFLLIGAVVSSAFANSDYWGASQKIKVGDESFVGYVISSQGDSITVMREDNRSLVSLRDGDIKSMEFCTNENATGMGKRTVFSYFDDRGAGVGYPNC